MCWSLSMTDLQAKDPFDVPKIRKNITAMTAMAATTMPNVIMDFFEFFLLGSIGRVEF